MKKLSVFLAVALAATACGTTDDTGSIDSTLTIDNDSSYAFIEINLAPVDSVSWGADLLGSDVLLPGEAVQVSGIDCDTYDIRIIDEDSDECVLDTVDLCLDNAVWRIDDAELVSCAF
jgi:hypothetical protein